MWTCLVFIGPHKDTKWYCLSTLLTRLAECYGIKPYDFIASLASGESGTSLNFEVPAQGDALKEKRFETMIDALGVDRIGQLKGTHAQIIDAIDNALRLAPKSQLRL